MEIRWLKMTDSTNMEAWRNKDTSPEGTVWCASYQTQGRGQRGTRWESAGDMNLTFSVLFRPERLRAADQQIISQICSVGVAAYLEDKGLDARIKWPNDVYVSDGKICGMLIENVLSSDMLAVSIAGIGLNVNQRTFPPELPNPVSVVSCLEAAGNGPAEDLDLRQELPLVVEHIWSLYGRLDRDGTVPGLEEEYLSRLYLLGEDAWFEETEYFTGGATRRFRGRIVGVEKQTARLLVEKEDGRISRYYFKEIKYIL